MVVDFSNDDDDDDEVGRVGGREGAGQSRGVCWLADEAEKKHRVKIFKKTEKTGKNCSEKMKVRRLNIFVKVFCENCENWRKISPRKNRLNLKKIKIKFRGGGGVKK